jgi:hypothetical protein
MSFLRRAPGIRRDATRVNFGNDVAVYVNTGATEGETATASVIIKTTGVMDATGTKTTSSGSISGTFTNRVWKNNSGAASNYYIRATYLSGFLTPTGTLNTWLQITSDRTWSASVTGSDGDTTFKLELSNSASGSVILDTVIVSFNLIAGYGA